jgi:hypothetical protein
MHKVLLFKDVRAEHVKVSHGPFVGLPSITALTGLGRQLCLHLCDEFGLAPHALSLESSLFAYDRYLLHEGFKKALKPGTLTAEALPMAWASFNTHLLFCLVANTPEAASALAAPTLREAAADILAGLRLCKGTLHPQDEAVNLASPRLAGYPSELARALALLPPRARIVRDRSKLVLDARAAGLPLMETFIAANLREERRPEPYRTFFAEYEDISGVLAPVLNGHFYLEDTPTGVAQRADVYGEFKPARATSAAYTLAEIQSVASVRCRSLPSDDDAVLWREVRSIHGEGVFNLGVPMAPPPPPVFCAQQP